MFDLCNFYREARAGMCLNLLFRNVGVLIPYEIQKLVEAYGANKWQIGYEDLGYYYPKAVKILESADKNREKN